MAASENNKNNKLCVCVHTHFVYVCMCVCAYAPKHHSKISTKSYIQFKANKTLITLSSQSICETFLHDKYMYTSASV